MCNPAEVDEFFSGHKCSLSTSLPGLQAVSPVPEISGSLKASNLKRYIFG